MTGLYDYLMNRQMSKYNTTCHFCKTYISLDDKDPYYFKIIGIGKYHKSIICTSCLKNKLFNNNNNNKKKMVPEYDSDSDPY